jgi:hypothetical protein
MNTIFACKRLPPACAMALAAILAGPASAGEPVPGPPALPAQAGAPVLDGIAQVLTAPATLAPQVQNNTLSIGGDTVQAVDPGQLDHERGRADTVLNDTKINGDVANNSATNVTTGSNTIDAGSFANMSGIPVVIQNSGANVLIQNATVINLQFQ